MQTDRQTATHEQLSKGISVSVGSVAAAGSHILSVCFGEITPDCYRQIRDLRISPQKPGNFSKADTENPKFRGDLRPTRDTELKNYV
jgi:hypothetical protein